MNQVGGPRGYIVFLNSYSSELIKSFQVKGSSMMSAGTGITSFRVRRLLRLMAARISNQKK